MTKKMKNLLLIATTAFCFCLLFTISIKADAGEITLEEQTTSSISFFWTPYVPTSAYSYTIDHYELTWKRSDSTDSVTRNVEPSYNGGTLSNLVAGSKYSITVKCIYSCKYSETGSIYTYTSSVASATLCTVPAKVTGLKEYSWDSNGSLQMTWTDQANVDGYHYQIINYTTGKKTKTNDNRYSNYLYETISTKYCYKVRVRSFMNKTDGTKLYGAWSAYKYIVPQPYAKASWANKAHTSVKLSWSKVNGASKYILYMSKKKKSGYKKVATIKQPKKSAKTVKRVISKFNKKKLSKGDYYVRVYAYKKMGSTTYKSKICFFDGFTIY